jgi:protein-disulfide isomerase
MASRTKQKEEARARRLAEERARAQKAERDRRLRIIAGVVLVAVIIVAVAIAISSGGGGTETGLQKKGTAQQNKTSTTVSSLLTGIPQSGAVLGNPKAPVTMTYYGDLECPVCQEFTLQGGFSELVAKDVRQGKVKVVYKAFQTATQDRNTFVSQQVAALAAGQQSKFWDFAELFYREQGQEDSNYVNEKYLDGLASQVPGLNLTKWESDRNNSSLSTQVETENQRGITLGVTGTPTLLFTGPKGQSVPNSSVPSYSDLEQSVTKVS